MLWAAGAHAPVSTAGSADRLAVVWGDALEGSRRVTADALAAAWARPEAAPLAAAYDGYYAALAYDARQGVRLGGDLLGLFPLYYAEAGGVLVIGSSPELFMHHPCLPQELDVQGFAGVLAVNGLANGRTLWQGIRRLPPGHVLTGGTGGPPRAVRQYALPLTDDSVDLPLEAHVQLADQALAGAIERQVPAGRACGLLLSGGLDSRILAGVMHRLGRRPQACTYGFSDDAEMSCALPVARLLDFPHRQLPITGDDYVPGAVLSARHEHLAGGFANVMYWGLLARTRDLPPAMISGYLMDAVMGGSHILWAYSPADRTWSFDRMFARANTVGVRLPLLRQLLGRQAGAVDAVAAELRAGFEAGAPRPFQRAWAFDLANRQRYHIGKLLWQLSFRTWPVVPMLDQALLAVLGGLPSASLSDRVVERELLCRTLPQLASLPLDHNARIDEPLRPRVRYVVMRPAMRALSGARAAVARWRRRERRFYYRLYDFNGPGWRSVRQLAEPHRVRLHDVFEPDALRQALPGVEESRQYDDLIAASSGVKMLVGAALLAGRRSLSAHPSRTT